MQPLHVGNLAQVRVWCDDSEQAAVNSFWYKIAAAGASPATDQDLAAFMDTNVGPGVKPMIANTASYRGCQVQIFDPNPPYKALYSMVFDNTQAGAGTAGAIGLPRQSAGLGEFQTGLAGPQGRGRWFVPFPAAAHNAGNGQPTAAYGVLLSAATSFFASGVALSVGGRTATLVRIIHHAKRNKAGLYADPNPVTGSTASPFWATQRKRGDFGRSNKSPI